MEEYNSYFISLHDINLEENSSKKIKIGNQRELEVYIANVIERRLNDKKAKYFKIKSDSTLVISNVLKIQKNVPQRHPSLEEIAFHLLKVESKVDTEANKAFTSVKRGILVQSLLDYGQDLIYLLAKIEYNAFLDESDWRKHIGLPYEKHVLKSCLIKFAPNPGISEIMLYDSNPRIATYWKDFFLELDEVRSNNYNTEISFKAKEKELTQRLEKEYLTDLSRLMDRLKGYYESHSNYDFEEMIDSVFRSYQPQNPKLDMDKIISIISNLPEKKKFDRIFPIALDSLSTRVEYVIPVATAIDLVLRDSIENLGDTICIDTNPLGRKFLKIRVDEGVSLPDFPICS